MCPEGATLGRGLHLSESPTRVVSSCPPHILVLIKCPVFIQWWAGDGFIFACLRRACQLSLRRPDSADWSKRSVSQRYLPSAVRSLCSIFCGLDVTPTLNQNWAVLVTCAAPHVATVFLKDAFCPLCCHFRSSVRACPLLSISLGSL